MSDPNVYNHILSLLDSLSKKKFGRASKSVDWFKDKVSNLKGDMIGSDRSILGEKKIFVSKPKVGNMCSFLYVPIKKKQLPYYDMTPLTMVIESYSDGFLGLNLHYLKPRFRQALLNELYSYLNNDKMDETTRLRISYGIISRFSRFKYAIPCIKRYKTSRIRSKILKVPPKEWNLAIYLPSERFRKATKASVWVDSINKIRKKGKK